ncbi:hypothetical protein AB0K48_26005, partial [Nonomuraea sp. NPDC055795]
MDQSPLATRLLAALTLNNPPVALTFVNEAPDGIPLTKEVVPADLTAGFGEQYRSCLEVAAELLKVAGIGP